jgi:hypothetical protein
MIGKTRRGAGGATTGGRNDVRMPAHHTKAEMRCMRARAYTVQAAAARARFLHTSHPPAVYIELTRPALRFNYASSLREHGWALGKDDFFLIFGARYGTGLVLVLLYAVGHKLVV